jgi:hypothetical protein
MHNGPVIHKEIMYNHHLQLCFSSLPLGCPPLGFLQSAMDIDVNSRGIPRTLLVGTGSVTRVGQSSSPLVLPWKHAFLYLWLCLLAVGYLKLAPSRSSGQPNDPKGPSRGSRQPNDLKRLDMNRTITGRRDSGANKRLVTVCEFEGLLKE